MQECEECFSTLLTTNLNNQYCYYKNSFCFRYLHIYIHRRYLPLYVGNCFVRTETIERAVMYCGIN